MRRRALGSAVLAAGLMTSGVLPLLGQAHAAACPSWTDPKDDASADHVDNASLRDTNMDIVKAGISTIGTDLVATITVVSLKEGFTGAGDRYVFQANFGGTFIRFYADRDETGFYSGLSDPGGVDKGAASAVFDSDTETVTITATQAELDKAVGKATKGTDAINLEAKSGTQANGTDMYEYDTAPGTGLTWTVGAACTPPLTKVVLPMPSANCSDFTDGPSDGKPTWNGAQLNNDNDIDIRAVAFNSTASTLYAYVKVEKLGNGPANFQGDRFDYIFKVGTKKFTFSVGRQGAGWSPPLSTDPNRGQVDGTKNPGLKVAGTFDQAANTVIIAVDRKALDTVNGSPVGDGTTVTEVSVATWAMQPGLQFAADTAAATAAADQVYKVGNNKCFTPTGLLANVGKTTAQYTDAAAVAAKLTANGTPLAGKNVTFAVGAKSVTAKTLGDGVARANLNPGVAAGTYSMVVTFAGDASATAATLTVPFTVSVEKTKVVLSVVKNGAKRTVVAKLLDDDNRPVAGQVVTFFINGKKVSAPKTNASGVATLATAKPTQTVKASFTTVAGKFQGSSAQIKV